jgi:hypothetical protein
MAIVLAVIGLIIGGIAIAKDVQRNAEYQKIANKFVCQWKAAYDQHYQRTNVVVGDCQQAPTYMIDGEETTFQGTPSCTRAGGATKAGIPENFESTGRRICNGQGYTYQQVSETVAPTLATDNLRTLMSRVGVRMPPGRGEGHEDRYIYQDSNGNAAELQICFQWNPRHRQRRRQRDGDAWHDARPGPLPGSAHRRQARFARRPLPHPGHSGPHQRQPGQCARHAMAGQQHHRQRPIQGVRPHGHPSGNADSASVATTATQTGREMDEDRVVLLTGYWVMEQ